MTNEKLKPCPFCGSYHVRVCTIPTGYKLKPRVWYVRCDDCESRGTRVFDKSEAIAAWNARADSFTREDVESAFVSGYSLGTLPVGSDPRWDQNETTLEEEMEELGWVRERTCEIEGSYLNDFTNIHMCWYEFEMACGGKFTWDEMEPPKFCPNCGAKVIEEKGKSNDRE